MAPVNYAPRVRLRTEPVIVVALGFMALIAGLMMQVLIAERVPHIIDEIAYQFQAQVFARGNLWAPPQPSAFFTPFVVTIHEHRVGKYPIGWPMLLAPAELIGAGWLMPPILHTVTTMLIYQIGRDLYHRRAGIIGAMLAALSPFALIQAALMMSHTAAAFWVALILWSLLRADQVMAADGHPQRWIALLGASTGMLAITRPYTALAVSVPLAIVLLVRMMRQPGGLSVFVRVYWPVAASIPIAMLQPLWLLLVTGSPTTNLYALLWPYDRVGFGPEFGPSGHTLAQGLVYTRESLLKGWVNDLYGWPGLSWVPVAAGLVFGSRWLPPHKRFWPWLSVGIFASIVVFHVAFWGAGWGLGPRYYFEAHGPLAVLAGIGIVGASERVLKPIPSLHRYGAHLGYAILALMLAINLGLYLPGRLARLRAEEFVIRRAPVDALNALVQDRYVLVFSQQPGWVNYGALFSLNNPWYDGQIVVAHDIGPGENARIVALHPGRDVWYYRGGVFAREPFPDD
jgi:hypothetical protein